jgi:hypothetical protein
MPDDERQWVIDAAKTVPGVLSAYHLVDRATGNGLSVSLFEDDVDVAQVKAAIAEKAPEIGWMTCRVQLRYPRPSTGLSEAAEPHCLSADPVASTRLAAE